MHSMVEAPPLAIVVVTRNRRASLLRSLARLTALEVPYPLIVVDNGSTDDTVPAVVATFPDIRVLPLGANHGAAARNRGVAQVTEPYVAFADDDSWWAPGALTAAVRRFQNHPQLGLLAAQVLVGAEQRQDLRGDRPSRGILGR